MAAVVASPPAAAQYTLPRGNRERTGRVATPVATGEAPSRLWRYFTGGIQDAGSPLYLDAGEDGTTDLLLLAGGLLEAKQPNNIMSWAASTVDLRTLVGIRDLDGDGSLEAVVTGGGGRLVVVSAVTGEVRFDDSLVPAIGLGVRLLDLDGDGLDDVYFPTAACGAGGTDEAVALSFAAGTDRPTELWRLEAIERDYYCGHHHVFADLEGDGAPEVVALGMRQGYAFDASTGSFRFGSDDIGRVPYGLALCSPVDVQADGDEELVCFSDRSYPPPSNARRVFTLDLDTERQVLVLLWTADVADLVSDRNAFVAESVADLDWDGLPEVVHSFYDGAAGMWTTFVREGRTGEVLASWPGGRIAGLVDLDADGGNEILVSTDSRMEALHYGQQRLESLWQLDGVTVTRVPDRADLSSRGLVDRPAVLDTELGPALILQPFGAGVDITSYLAVRLSAVDAEEVARYDAPAGAVFTGLFPLDDSPDPSATLVAATSESRLITLDSMLRATNRVDDPEFPVLGVRHGGLPRLATGLSAFPLSADANGDGAAELILGDSRGDLSMVDARGASMTVEPTPIWSVPRAGYAAFFDAGGSGLAAVAQTGAQLRAFDARGEVLWDAELPGADQDDLFPQDPLPFPVTGGRDAIFINRQRAGTSLIEGLAISGTNGLPLWSDWVPLGFASDPPRSATWADLDSDGVGMLITSPAGGTLAAYDVDDGSVIRSRTGFVLNMPAIVDLDADGRPEVLGTAQTTLSAADSSFEDLWTIEDEAQLANYGAVANCPSPVWVTGMSTGPELRTYDLDTGALRMRATLAGGSRFDNLGAAQLAGTQPGSLHAVTVAPSADGTSEVALVGSSDGYLYALDACNLEIQWSVALGATVMQAVPADPEGSGRPVIVTTVGDGYVYGLGIPEIPPPGVVLDVDPPSGISDRDVDEIDTLDTLYGVWEGVAGVEYEVSVVTSDLAPVTSGFLPVGARTEATVDGLDLRLGVTYLFAVRAHEGARTSPESLSDGVVVVDRTPPELAVTAAPDRLAAGTDDASQLSIRASDRRGLALVSAEVRAPGGATIEILVDAAPTNSTFEWTEPWDALLDSGHALEPGSYLVVARALDNAGLESTASAHITVVEGDVHWSRVRGGGCTCDVPEESRPNDRAAFVLLAAVALLARRRRVRGVGGAP